MSNPPTIPTSPVMRNSRVIINQFTCFSRLLLYSDLYATITVSVLCGTNNALRAIVLLFCQNVFQSFGPAVNSVPFQLYLLIQDLSFAIPCGSFSMF